MARFGQGFIQALTNPSYQQGLFTAAQGPGIALGEAAEEARQQSMVEQLKNMSPLETAEYMITEAKTPDQLNAAKTAKNVALSQAGKQSIDVIQSQLLAETDPARMKQLEDAMVQTAQQTGNVSSQYRGSASKLLSARDEAAWKATKRNNEQRALVEGNTVDFVVAQMLARGDTEIPKTVKTPNGEVPIPENLTDEIQKQFVESKKAADAFQAAIEGASLPEAYVNYINSNPQLLEDNAALNAQIKIIEETNGKGSSVRRTNAINALKSLVDTEQAETRANKKSAAALEMDVNALVESIITSENRTYFWEGDTMQDFLSGGGSEEEIQAFREQAVQTLKQNPNATIQEVIDGGMTGMRRKIPAQKRQKARDENAQSQANRIAAIEQSVKKANPDLSDAQVTAVVQRKLREMQIEAFGRQAQTSRAFQ